MLSGPSDAVSIAEILRQQESARAEQGWAARRSEMAFRPRQGSATRFSEHLSRLPADEPVSFSVFLHRQNKEDRAAARRAAWWATTGRVIDVYG